MLISTLIILIVAGSMLAASYTDLTSFKIPNWISLVLLAGFVVVIPFVWPGWAGLGTHLLVGLVCFIAGIVMFALGWMGGGDAKLLAATSIWWVWSDLLMYLVYTAVAGGALALFLILARRFFPVRWLTAGWLYRLLKDEKRMPYGLALAAGALATLPQSALFLAAGGV